MLFHWQTLALQTANFAILVWLLHRFLYKPVLRMVDARRAAIQRDYDAAAAAQEQARAQLAAMQAERAGIAAERDAALKAAAEQAEQAARQRAARAEVDADALLAGARKTLAVERAQALVEARSAALALGADIARRLLAELPESLRAEGWLERIEQYLAGLPDAEVSALVAGNPDITVVTSALLSVEIQDTWRTRLRRLFGDAREIAFAADPQLVAGVELHLATAVLRFSWQSALSTIRSDLDAHADAG